MESQQPKSPSLSWLEVWTLAITKPDPTIYRQLTEDPGAKPRRAIVWLIITSIMLSLVAFNLLFNNPQTVAVLTAQSAQTAQPLSEAQISQALFITALCALPLAAIFNTLIYGILAFAIQFVADQMGVPQRTNGKFKALFYLVGAIVAPMNVVLAVLNMLPILSILAIGAYVYQIFLMIRAAQGLYGMDGRTAAIVVGAPMLIFTLLQIIYLNGALA
jgi:hypothetical protein